MPVAPDIPEKPSSSKDAGGALFSAADTTLFRVTLIAVVTLAGFLSLTVYGYYHSYYWNLIGRSPDQPVLFSHRHHAGELRIDCRNCHAGVEKSAFAGMPSTQTCLSCHSQIFTHNAMLEPVVRSAVSGVPLRWNRVTRLPDHVYFNHSIHVNKGVGCTTCHGDIGNMPLTAKAEPMTMRWCLDCHRDPGPRLRPRSEIFRSDVPPGGPSEGSGLLQLYQIHPAHLTNCSTCHH